MGTINNATSLKNAIKGLELNQSNEWLLLKEQFLITVETFRPSNIIKDTLSKLFIKPGLDSTTVYTILGVTSGLVTNAILRSNTANPVIKIGATVMAGLAAKFLARNKDKIKAMGGAVMKKGMANRILNIDGTTH
ncbi:MAG: hypothetical protein U5K54_02745 [Cytophagales bacterium]|nr:hypothetical protein [Cytophagales bacterium]